MYEYRKACRPHETGYMLTDYTLDDYPDEWLFDLDHDDDWCDWQCAKLDMFEDVLSLAMEAGCVGIWNGASKLRYYLHRSTRHDGMQLTCFDDRGPLGHADVDDAERLAFEVCWNDFTAYTYEEAA